MSLENVPSPVSEPTEILHLSDTHIGYSLRERDDEYNQNTVDWIDEVDCLEKFRRAMKVGVDRDVDAVLHTGDVFDDVVEREQIDSFREVLEETVGAADIPFCYVLGNHDPEIAETELENLERAGIAEHLSIREAVQIGNVAIYGTDYQEPDWWRNPPLRFDEDVPSGAYKLLCLHQSVVPIRPSTDAPTVDAKTVLRESNVDFDLLALGHEHYPEYENLNTFGCEGYYPGPTERISDKYQEESPQVNLYTFSEEIGFERLPFDTE